MRSDLAISGQGLTLLPSFARLARLRHLSEIGTPDNDSLPPGQLTISLARHGNAWSDLTVPPPLTRMDRMMNQISASLLVGAVPRTPISATLALNLQIQTATLTSLNNGADRPNY